MENSKRWYRRLAGVLAARMPEARLDDVADPRARRGRRWKQLHVLLAAVVTAICAGAKSLANLEKMTVEMAPAMRRRLGILRRIPDTTLRDVLCKLEPRELRRSLHAQIRAAHRRKALEPNRLPFGVLVMDGKATALTGCDDVYAQRQSQDDGEQFTSVLRTVTCSLVSAAAKPCIDAIPIPASTNEMGHFPTALREVVRAYGPLDLFRLVDYDAGACSLENANLVRELKLHYLFGLKGTQPTLLAEAKRWLEHRTAADAVSEDVVGANIVTRRLYITEEMAGFGDWIHLRTVLRIESETRTRDGLLVAHDNRYRISSLSRVALSDSQWLRLVREHWAVENQCHHTFDTVFCEDDKPWIEDSPKGALAVLLLRRIAYNLMALFRSVTQRSDERRAMPWADLLRGFAHALVVLSTPDLADLRPRVNAALV